MAFLGFGKDPVLPPTQSILEPRLKPGQRDVHSYKPGAFNTQKGRLLVPRMKDPPQPTCEMVTMALSGKLSSVLTESCTYRASDLVGQVSAQTAKISLDEMYEYQTRQLTYPLAESTKSLRTLFYVSLKSDELPSYHFWTAPDDPDPVAAGKPTDWDAEFKKLKPAEWDSMQQYANEDDDSQIYDDLFNEPPPQASMKPQESGSATLRDRFGKPRGRKSPSPPISAVDAHNKYNASNEKSSTAEKPSSQPGGMEYARSLHILSLDKQHLLEVANTSPKGSASQKEAKSGNEGIPTSTQSSGQIGKSNARSSSVAEPDATSRQGPMLAVAKELNKEQHRESSILLRFEWGAIYLDEFTHTAFRQLARYMTQYEQSEMNTGFNPLFVDILKPGGTASTEYRVPDSGSKGSRDFAREIKPYLGLPGHHFRIRSNAYTARLPFDNSQPGTLKLTRVGFGYCYVDAVGSWISTNSTERMESSANFQSGISFLFGRDKSGAPIPEKEIPKLLTLEIYPQIGAIDISDWFVSRELGETFHYITSSQLMTSGPLEPVSWKYSAEIFVHETGDTFIHPDALAAAAQGLRDDEAIEAQEARLLEQQLAQENNVTASTTQQTDGAEWSTTPPRTVLEIEGGPEAPSVRPRVRTQAEIEELERRLEIAEARLSDNTQAVELDRMHIERGLLRSQTQGLEGQIKFLTGENDRLETRVRDLDNRVDELEKEGDQLKSQVEKLGGQAGGLKQERDQLESRVNNLQEEAVQSAEDCELLRLTVNNLEGQALRSTRKCDQLQSRVGDAERRTVQRTQQRDQLQIQVDRLTRHASAGSDPNQIATQTEDPQPQTQAAVNLAAHPPSGVAGPKRLLFCIVCLSSVDKINPNVRSNTLK